MEMYYTFANTHTVILAEKLLLAAGLPVKIRPLPTVISAGCGLCICIPYSLQNSAEAQMLRSDAFFSAAYLFDGTAFKNVNSK